MQKIWFHLVKDMVSPCERYGFALWKIRFCPVKDKVSRGERYGFVDWEIHFELPKKQKKDYPALILLSICISNGYRKTIHTGTYTETHTEPALEPSLKNTAFGVPADWLWFHKIQVMMTRMKRTTCMVWWLSLRFQLQRYNKNLRFPNFREYLPQFLRQSVLTLKPMEHFGAQKQDAAPSCWKDSKNRRCCHVSYE